MFIDVGPLVPYHGYAHQAFHAPPILPEDVDDCSWPNDERCPGCGGRTAEADEPAWYCPFCSGTGDPASGRSVEVPVPRGKRGRGPRNGRRPTLSENERKELWNDGVGENHGRPVPDDDPRLTPVARSAREWLTEIGQRPSFDGRLAARTRPVVAGTVVHDRDDLAAA